MQPVFSSQQIKPRKRRFRNFSQMDEERICLTTMSDPPENMPREEGELQEVGQIPQEKVHMI
jgi:hypothetical protein